MNKLRIAYVIIFTLLISLAVSVATSYAGEYVRLYDLTDEDGTFKLYEDGVTWKITEEHGFLYDAPNISIIKHGLEFDCLPDGYHANQYLNPICVEIIMRSIP